MRFEVSQTTISKTEANDNAATVVRVIAVRCGAVRGAECGVKSEAAVNVGGICCGA